LVFKIADGRSKTYSTLKRKAADFFKYWQLAAMLLGVLFQSTEKKTIKYLHRVRVR